MGLASRGRLMVVDDEPALLRMLHEYLTRLGYEVQACSSARDALDVFAASPSNYDLVLADLTMPEMSGMELVVQLLRFNPRASILLCSGYPFDLAELPAPAQHQIRFLQKPFSPQVLAETIEELINGEPTSD
jgi:two-component system cell cycle sensor histidine kinase/response regulator CckA